MDPKGLDELVDVLVRISDAEDCRRFLTDLCTVQELDALTQRLSVARMLSSGAKYADIAAATGASTATISRVKRSLSYGSGGYSGVLRAE